MREVARRYLAAYGPATAREFARWFGITSPAEAGRWLAALGDEVVEVEVEGERGAGCWPRTSRRPPRREPAGVVRLLPAFDHYVVAAPRDADAVLAAAQRARVYRPQGWLSPVLLVDGRIAGVWSHERRGAAVAVEVEPFERRRARGCGPASRPRPSALAAFLGGALELALPVGCSRRSGRPAAPGSPRVIGAL